MPPGNRAQNTLHPRQVSVPELPATRPSSGVPPDYWIHSAFAASRRDLEPIQEKFAAPFPWRVQVLALLPPALFLPAREARNARSIAPGENQSYLCPPHSSVSYQDGGRSGSAGSLHSEGWCFAVAAEVARPGHARQLAQTTGARVP